MANKSTESQIRASVKYNKENGSVIVKIEQIILEKDYLKLSIKDIAKKKSPVLHQR